MSARTWHALMKDCRDALVSALGLSIGQAGAIAVKLNKSDLAALIAALRGRR